MNKTLEFANFCLRSNNKKSTSESAIEITNSKDLKERSLGVSTEGENAETRLRWQYGRQVVFFVLLNRLASTHIRCLNRIFFVFCITLLFSSDCRSQISVNGKVLTSLGEPLSYANVLLLLNEDSSLVKGSVSGENGQFSIDKMVPGNYLLAVSMIGFETTISTPFLISSPGNYTQDDMVLKEMDEQLQGVEVVAKKPLYEQKIDRMVINVHNTITSAGGNALEVLSRSPGINVNEVNNILSLNGKSDVLVLVDGKASRMPLNTLLDVLRGMDANNIEKIELFDTPPAQLDAGGSGGAINIIMKKNKGVGMNGSYSLSAGYGKRLKTGGTVNLNYRKNKINVYGSYNFRMRNQKQTYLFHRNLEQSGALVVTDSENQREKEKLRNTLRVGMDYNISKRTVVGFLLSSYISDETSSSFNNSTFSTEEVSFSIVDNFNKEENNWKHGLVNINIQHYFSKKESISLDIDGLYYGNNNPSSYENHFFDGEQTLIDESEVVIDNESPIRNLSGKIDYNLAISDKIDFKFGVKSALSRFSNTIEVKEKMGAGFVVKEDFSQDYKMKEDIGAVYSAMNFKLNEKTQMNFGLRYEHTDYLLSTSMDPQFLDRSKGYLFPSLFISRTFNQENRMQFSYGRRISRPAFNELAPFVTFIDPNTFFRGNPELLPGISNNAKLGYRFKRILLSAQYSYTDGPIYSFQPVLDTNTNTQTYTTLNLDKETNYSLSLIVPINPTTWWEIQNKFLGNLERITYHNDSNADVNLKTNSFVIDMTHTITLPKDFTLEIAGQYQSPSFYGLLKVESQGFVNIGLQKKMANDKGTLRFIFSDIFQTNIWSSVTTIPELNLDNTLSVITETRVFRVNYFTTFGNSKVKKSRKRETSSEEEQRRVW